MKFTIFAILFFCGLPAHAKIVEQVLAVVEGHMILSSDVKTFSKKLKKKNLINENLIGFLGLNTKKTSDKEILNYLVSKKIITSFALKDLNLTSSESIVEKEVANLAKQNRISQKQLKKEIVSRGINYTEYKDFVAESSLIRSAIEKHVVSRVRPTEEDFVQFLKTNGVRGIKPSYVFDLDQIFIPKNTSDAKNLSSLINKDNFKKYFASAEKLKLQALKLGTLRASDLSPTTSKALIKTSEDNISQVFKEDGGYRIFFVNLKKNNYSIPKTARVTALQKKFYDQQIQAQFISWLNEIKPSFFVRLND